MTPFPRRALLTTGVAAVLAAAAAPSSAQAMDCEQLREQIAGKLRAGGIAQPRLQVLDKDAVTTAAVVGRCELGSRKIVRLADGAGRDAAASAPAATRSPAPPRRAASAATDDDLLTECLDGSVQRGGDCGRRRSRP